MKYIALTSFAGPYGSFVRGNEIEGVPRKVVNEWVKAGLVEKVSERKGAKEDKAQRASEDK